MSERMYRAQLLLKLELHRRLCRIAERGARGISDVSRDLLGCALQQCERETAARVERIRSARTNAESILRERGGVCLTCPIYRVWVSDPAHPARRITASMGM